MLPNQTVVLVVEDEFLIREMAAEALAEAGYEVLEAATGERALAYLKERGAAIGVLFTDIQLGGPLNGWDVADAFRGSIHNDPSYTPRETQSIDDDKCAARVSSPSPTSLLKPLAPAAA